MTSKASPTPQDLPPIQWEPLRFIPVPDVRELSPESGWAAWDLAVEEMQEEEA